jgi:hypothetical protein
MRSLVRSIVYLGLVSACSPTVESSTVPDNGTCDPNGAVVGAKPCASGKCQCNPPDNTDCRCAPKCSDTKPCALGYCRFDPTGGNYCTTQKCSNPTVSEVLPSGEVAGEACINQQYVLCSRVPPEIPSCGCGCPSDAFCDGTQCQPKVAIGAACSLPYACTSNFCRKSTGKCEAPLNGQCTSSNCSDCVVLTNNKVCIQECTSDKDCPFNALFCIGYKGVKFCTNPCAGSQYCPSGQQCVASNNNVDSWCVP